MDSINKFIVLKIKHFWWFLSTILIISIVTIVEIVFMAIDAFEIWRIIEVALLTFICLSIILFFFEFFFLRDDKCYRVIVNKIRKELGKELNIEIKEEPEKSVEYTKNKNEVFKKANNIAPGGIMISLVAIGSSVLLSRFTNKTDDINIISSYNGWFLAVLIATIVIGFIILNTIHKDVNYEIRTNILKSIKEEVRGTNCNDASKDGINKQLDNLNDELSKIKNNVISTKNQLEILNNSSKEINKIF